MSLNYPIGLQDFEKIREEGKVYIDKTSLILDLVNRNSYVFLARPRRFGKSLLLSTIKAYFEGKKELFRGLDIENLEEKWEKHPVFLIELSRVNSESHEALKALLNQQFSIWEEELGIINRNNHFGSRFSSILIESFKKTGKRAVILVDEYDNPLINTLEKEETHEQNRNLLKSIYSNFKALDQYIRFGMLTGVSRFSKMSVFSGLNNLNDISLDNRYGAICGIAESEIDKFLPEGVEELGKHLDLSYNEAKRLLKKNYDGYHFSKNSEDIYNPFSLLCALQKKEPGEYWFATGTPTFLIKKLFDENIDLNSLMTSEAASLALSSSDFSHSSPLALLFQTGYLTIKGFDTEWDTYKLGIPNREVKKGLLSEMSKVFQAKRNEQSFSEIRKMVETIRRGKPQEFLEILKSFFASIPYTLTQNSSELFFENNFYIILNLLGLYCDVEIPTSSGRIDSIIKTTDFIYIFEFKYDGSADLALKQINEKNYFLPYLKDGRPIFKIGVNFSSETRNISDWKIERQ